MKPDIIVAWPRNCDYPLWRQFIRNNRQRFNLVIVVFTETNIGEDYRQFVRNAMHDDWILFVENPIIHNQDWRNIAVNHALIQSFNAEWIWFTEQDFTIENPEQFFGELDKAITNGAEWAGVYDGPRLHPCCIFMKRSTLNKVSKDFSAAPPLYDHFGRIQKDLEQLELPGYKIEKGWNHMAGLSHNMRLVNDGQPPVYKPEEFNDYLKRSLEVSVLLDPRYNSWVSSYLSSIK